MLLFPLAVLGNQNSEKEEKEEVLASITKKDELTDVFKVYDKTTGKIAEISAEDYIFGVVAAEMPARYETEALKAQAVAAYTYACSKRLGNKNKPYDITTDYTIDQSFKTKTEARKVWGSKADEYTEKIENAVSQTIGIIICKNNKPISAVYHAVSGGNTYSAKDVWGKEVSYLQAKPCEGDKLAENYISVVTLTEKEIKNALVDLEINPEKDVEIKNIKTSKSGLVSEMKINGKKVTGNDIREALKLASSNFKYEKKDKKHIFTCYGYGHGVGMSQYGANDMAIQGYNYEEILRYFYTDCNFKKFTDL